jgi:hypothetical protein
MMDLSESQTIGNRKRRQGAAAVEFAFAISILLLIVFASIEFVRLNMMEHSIDHASYLAARKGIIVGANVDDVQEVAENHLLLFSVTGAEITVSPNPITDESDLIEVSIDVPMAGNSWMSPLYFNGTMRGRTRMLAERTGAEMAAAVARHSATNPATDPTPDTALDTAPVTAY